MITLPSGNFLVTSVDELPNFANSHDLFMDFETKSGDPKRGGTRPYHGDRIAGIAVTADDHVPAFYIPIRHNGLWAEKSNLPLEPVLRWMADCLKTSKDWVNHNVKFDAHFAHVDGAEFGGRLVDTLTLSKIYYSDSLTYGLKALCRDWLGMEMGESLKLKAYLKGIQSKDFADAPADIVGDYACEDVQSNRALYRFLCRKKDPEVDGVWETEIALTPVLYDMEQTGMPVEPFELDKQHFQVLNGIIQLQGELYDLTGKEINPRSSPQIYDLFVNQMGFPVADLQRKITKDANGRFNFGNPTFDKKAMKIYSVHPHILGNPERKRTVDLLGKYREEAQYLSLFIEPYKEMQINNILHPSYNQAVRTGRMSCSSPNAQQLNKRAKKLIHPLEGEGMLSYDYCLTGETEILTPGGPIPIKNLVAALPANLEEQEAVGLQVMVPSGDDENLVTERITRGARIGKAAIYKIRTSWGDEVRATSDHKWKRKDGTFALTKELLPGDELQKWVGYDGNDFYLGTFLSSTRVVSIVPDGFENIYQITVEPSHCYVLANGLVSRNSQVEYRLIVHYIRDPVAIAAYAKDPLTDFHQFVADQCGINRKQAKNLNFAMGYGAGKNKVLSMLETDPTLIADVAQKFLNSGKSLADSSREFTNAMQELSLRIYNNYHERLPGLRQTSRAATDTAKMRGYVFNAYGRRRHLQNSFTHRAFNSIIQPCAADLMKERLVHLAPRYNSKIRAAGLRIMANVHDETVFRGPKEAIIDPGMQRYIKDELEDTSVKFRVPIVVGGGVSLKNWAEASGDKPTTDDEGIGGPIEWETDSVGAESEEHGIGFE